MISVGVDVSKGKSTVCVMKPYGEIVLKPFEVQHTESELSELEKMLRKLDGEVRLVMEATGVYHLPLLTFFLERGYFVSVINPYAMRKYAKDNSIRGAKTDKLDSIVIANYGIEKWYKLQNYDNDEAVYAELKLLGRRYRFYMELHIKALQELTHMLDYTMPGLKTKFNSWDEKNNKDKLSDFVERFWHYDLITGMSRDDFVVAYCEWAKEKKYQKSQSKAEEIYELASNGIPTLSSSTPSTKMLVQEAISVLRAIDDTLNTILTRMKELAKSLPEYSTVRAMGGVGDVLAPKLIAEIGDIRKLHSAKALIAVAGIDPPPYESGQFVGSNRRITKRGSSTLRKVGYEVMRVLKSHPEPEDNAVYNYILKKEAEGKTKKHAKIAGLNKFLRIYYARVSEVYK
ncbi:Transposase IS116/IS110/IS902 family protein [Pseudobutyrivibrio sp. 49]|uniref:IS110 family transposase n=1 Tax=Pseudobutyrivibrio sp. 49 TaxID=1855344 RepID=UPI0008895AF3|nr:IS110 family transposase [Pseudobutyrivibrio sp. 49]SDI56981.1 Transposase IS116/IS110/IS902 family protein [Pseudobutyrivibrio sp. 49]